MIDLNEEDLDDDLVSLLIEHGLGSRFPTPCNSWRSCTTKSKETTQKRVFEGKQRVDEQLNNDQPLLEDTLAWEMVKRILDACP